LGLLAAADALALKAGYSFLRMVEARLRVVTDRPLTELPENAEDRGKLARRLGFEPADGHTSADCFLNELTRVTTQIRQLYTDLTARDGTDL
jgi:glutamate-ammonia-ligase adenylyltransferase